MANGKIVRFNNGRGFGFIQRAGQDDIFFHISAWQGSGEPKVGQQVSYSEGMERGRSQATNVRPMKATQTERSSDGYQFINPYNFVRSLPEPSNNTQPLLGRAAPPPHDRFVGLSGKIRCQLTAQTPLFTADSARVERDPKNEQHMILQFFELDGKPTIPGSTLRGTFRSVFEAVTNSCFGVFDGHRRLSAHLEAHKAPQMVPARVAVEDGKWQLQLLTGSTDLQVGRIPYGRQYAAWLHTYWPTEPSGSLTKPDPNQREQDFQRRRSKGHIVNLHGLQHKDECWALIEEVTHPFPKIKFWDVREVRPIADKALLSRPQRGQRIEKGYLCLNNQNIERKHSERFFFRDSQNKVGPISIELPPDVIRDYCDLIADYQSRHADEVRMRRENGQPVGKIFKNSGDTKLALSRFIYEQGAATLQGGDLVYAFLSGDRDDPQIDFIVPVTVPRVAYERRIGQLLQGMKPCQDINHLCPACRTFGWVWRSGDWDKDEGTTTPADNPMQSIAYAGRVRISDATLKKDGGTFTETMAILSSPKPTTARFYLMNEEGQDQNGLEADQVDYNAAGQILRGRKFYYHHGSQLQKREYERTEGQRDDQNRTLQRIQDTGSEFSFEVDFENLSEVELGAIIWTLELEGWNHRFGMAKPLGFGSATVTIDSLRLLDYVTRYFGDEDGWQKADKVTYVEAFKDAMSKRYQVDFERLNNVADLRAILSESPPLPVHYPRSTQEPSKEGKNFEWFVGNSREGRNAGPRYTLPLPSDDNPGLPLVDKSGRIRKS